MTRRRSAAARPRGGATSTAPAPLPQTAREPDGYSAPTYAVAIDGPADDAIAIPASVRAALSASDSEFVPAQEDIVGDIDMLDMLDMLDVDASCRQAVRREIDDVLAKEAPIAAARLARIVGRRFTLQRVAAKRAATILGLVPAAQLEDTPFGRFVWAASQDRDAYDDFRIAGDEAARNLDEIAPNELVNAMRYLAKGGVGTRRSPGGSR